jgi:NADH-quinone oxidoreductase subunit H
MTLLVVPFAPGLVGQDLNIGLLYFFAIGGLAVVGLLMGGWSSFNKYSLLGGLRSAVQVISYEIPLTLSVVGLILLAGTMSVNGLVESQSGSILDWYVFQQPRGALIFFIAATAEANRTPFDLTEADSGDRGRVRDRVLGMRFGFFYFAEYVNVFIVSAMMVSLFFGGWNAPFDWPFPVTLDLDPAALGVGLLLLLAVVPILGTLALAAPFWLARTDRPTWALQASCVHIVAVAAIVITPSSASTSRQHPAHAEVLRPCSSCSMRGTLPGS